MADAEERGCEEVDLSAATHDGVDDVFHFVLPARPYPGLRPFGKDEWPIFFGRERMIDEIIERLIAHQFLVVHGDSGCGKSSLIRAGVLTRLEQECARGGARWLTCVTVPGDEPLANLASALAVLDGQEDIETRILEIRRILNCGREGAAPLADYVCAHRLPHVCILIDQFEEIFAHARRRGTQQASLLVDLLIGLHDLAAPRLCVVLTMRSEFLGACAKFEGFARTVNATQYLLPRMEHADLMRAIREPAPLYEGEVAPDLAERLIADAGGNQDQLPLIQHALMFLYRDVATVSDAPWRLTLESYRARGRLEQLLSDHADEVMRTVDPPGCTAEENSRVTEDVFRALTDINADGQATRRPQKLRELMAVTGADEPTLRTIIDAFRAEGVSFLRPYGVDTIAVEDYVDISHEALIRCWTRIADAHDGWLIREFKNGLVWRSLLVQTDSFEKDDSNVLSPATTEERQAWLKRRNAAWSQRYGGDWERVLKLVEASEAARKQQMQAEIEARTREEQAKMQEQRAKLREQELQANLAVAVEKSRREKLFKWAFSLSMLLLSVAGFSAYSAYVDRGIAIRESGNAEQAARELQKSLDETEAKRKVAEASLSTIRRELAGLRQASDAAPDAIRRRIDKVQLSIGQQVTTLSNATRISPRLYINIAEESQREAAHELELRIEAGRIGDASVVVPGIKLLDSPPPYSLLRCFTAEDCSQYGPPLLELVNAQLDSPKIVLQDFSKTRTPTRTMRPQHFELYFVKGPIRLAERLASAR
ncbi:MAG: ATP-binding protein [Betaproteobacteria bacterium]